MRYEGDIYRPPSEAFSLLVQVTIGCSHNKCTFCDMYKAKRFRVRKEEDVVRDLEEAATLYRGVKRIFLCDGDALCLANFRLLPILDKIRELFPSLARVGIYARAKDILRKSDEEIQELCHHGLGIAYIGAESGSDRVLKQIDKGETAAELVEAVQKAEKNGLATSVTFISGMGGRALWEDHAVQSGEMISHMGASYVGLLTLMVRPGAPLYRDIQSGAFTLLTPEEVIQETYVMLAHAKPEKSCVFRSNHASNYLSLKGNLPEDRERLMALLAEAARDKGMLKEERFRLL